MRSRCVVLALLAVFLVVTAGQTVSGSVAVHFSPGIREHIIPLLDGAQESVDLAVYAFTDSDLASAVVRAHQRGVKVRVVMDARHSANRDSLDEFLAGRGVELGLDRGQGKKGMMHHKFAVIDGATVVAGSFDWTANAEEKNHADALIISEAGAAALYAAEFQRLWDEAQMIDPFKLAPKVPFQPAEEAFGAGYGWCERCCPASP